MKKFNSFINENLSIKLHKYIDTVVNYLKNNTDFDIYEYEEPFKVTKQDTGETFVSKLYLTTFGKAIRFNFSNVKLVSIDLWESFEFKSKEINNKPDFTMYVENSVVNILEDIVDFVNGDFKLYEDEEEGPVIKRSPGEDVELKSIKVGANVLDYDIDVFDAIKYYTMQIASKVSNSFVISGGPGLGKTGVVTETLDDYGIKYVTYKGDITASGLYETLFVNRNKLIIFDDCDSVFAKKNEESLNILKAALDTYKNRKISRILKTHFDSEGMSDDEMDEIYNNSGKLPKQFNYKGRMIFITNVPGDEIDPALISRGLHVDVKLSHEQILKRMEYLMDKLFPTYPKNKKQEVLEFMNYLIINYETKFPLNIRTLIHCINIRIANDFTMEMGGKPTSVWMLLIKQYLLKK